MENKNHATHQNKFETSRKAMIIKSDDQNMNLNSSHRFDLTQPAHLNLSKTDYLNQALHGPIESRHRSPKHEFEKEEAPQQNDDEFFVPNLENEKIELQLMQNLEGKFYRYRGPRDENINSMIEELDRLLVPSVKPIEIIKTFNRRIDNWFDKKNCCKDHLGPVTLSKDSLFLLITSLVVSLYISLNFQDYSSSSTGVQLFISNAAVIVFSFTIYGLIFLSLPPRWAFFIFGLQVFIPAMILLDDFGIYPNSTTANLSAERVFPKFIVIGFAVIWAVIYPCYRRLRVEQGRFFSHLFLIGLVIIGVFIAKLAFNLLDSSPSSGYEVISKSTFIIIFAGIFVSFSWIYIHTHYFITPSPMLESYILRYARKLLKKPNFTSDNPIAEIHSNGLMKRIMKNIYLIASIVVGGFYIAVEMFLAFGLVKSGDQSSSVGLVIFGVLFVANPAFLFFGLPLVTDLKSKPKDKMLFTPLIFIVLIFILIVVASNLDSSSTASSFSIYLVTGPPVALFFWLLMVLINIYYRKVFYLLMALSCVFFWVPVYILSPVSKTSVYGSDTVLSIVIYSLIGIGAGIIVLAILFKFLKFFFNLIAMKFKDLRNSYRIYKLQKLRIELKKLRIQRLGTQNELDRAKDEIEMIEEAEGIMDLGDLMPFSTKEVKSIIVQNAESMAQIDQPSSKTKTPPSQRERELADQIRMLSSQIYVEQRKENKISNQSERSKLLESKFKIKLKQLIYLNLKNFGYWINATSFVVSYTFIIYIYFNLGSTATAKEKGVLTALVIVIPVIFIILNSVIRMRSVVASPIENGINDTELRFISDQTGQDPKIVKHISKMEALFLLFGVVIIPICQIPLFFILSDSSFTQANFFAMITSILLSIIVAVILEIKKRSGPFHKFFVPAIVAACWLFFILPYLVLFPIVSAVMDGESSDYEIFLKVLVMTSAFCFLFLNTSLAIVLNVLLQKIEEEKLIKFVVNYLKKKLKPAGVKGMDISLRRLYDFYVKMGEKDVTDMLIRDRKPCLMVKIPEEKRTYAYSHTIWLFETYARAFKKLEEGNDPKPTKASCLERMFRCCFEDDADEQIEIAKNEQEPQELEEAGYERFKVDIYMPKDLQTKRDFVNGGLVSKQKMYMVVFFLHTSEKKIVELEESDKSSKDYMSPILEKIQQKVPSENEHDFENAKEHAKLMMYDIEEMEEWYQHLYDYFSGRANLSALDHKSSGMIYINFKHFMRLSCLNLKIDEDKSLAFFTEKSTKAKNEIRYLSYEEFIEILHQICLVLFPSIEGKKMLKKLTKLIYPPLMQSVIDVSKFYQERTRRYMQKNIIYEPHLNIFLGNLNTEEDQPLADLLVTDMYPDRSATPLRLANDKNLMVHPETIERTIDSNASNNKSDHGLIIPEKKEKTLQPSAFEKNSKKQKSSTKSCLKAMGMCLLLCESLCKRAAKACCRGMPTRFGLWLDIKLKKFGAFLGFDVDDLEDIDEPESKVRVEAPPWPEVVDIMIKNIPEAEKTYFEKEKNRSVRLMFNLTNVSAIFGKFIEIYSYLSYAFRAEIPWFSTPEVNIEVSGYLNILNGEDYSDFRYTFWSAVCFVVIYILCAIPALKALRKGTLGERKDGRPAGFPSVQFFIVLGVQTLGGSMFQNITKWLLNAFVCNFETSPWVLASYTSVQCLSNEHFVYITVGIICLLIYYPLCTFMFPNFQFRNKLLDLKYNPAWIVIVIQVKLLLSCFFTFFKASSGTDSSNVTTQLVATVIVLTILALSNLYLRPCLVKKFNIWDVGLYLLAAFTNLMSLLVYLTNSSDIIAICLGVGAFFIIFVTYLIHRMLFGRIVLRHKKPKVGNVEETLRYDETKRLAVHQDLESTKAALRDKNKKGDAFNDVQLVRAHEEQNNKDTRSKQDNNTDEELLKF